MQQYFVFTPHPEDSQMKTMSYCIDYLYNNEKWTATYSENKFHYYKNGNKDQSGTEPHIMYQTENGNHWRLEIKNDKMFVGPDEKSLKPGKMVYKGWDGAIWTAELVKFIDFHSNLKE